MSCEPYGSFNLGTQSPHGQVPGRVSRQEVAGLAAFRAARPRPGSFLARRVAEMAAPAARSGLQRDKAAVGKAVSPSVRSRIFYAIDAGNGVVRALSILHPSRDG
ncbi:hypothetical protein SAMN05216360_108151 [Methylobacterium phyllostachyos]|uniref:Uncharacterized protein n=1 Tax=Methylobacterium phyllostachyos TaxID=582672 RepID=A0A1H0BEY8_9HYPH|nr:hypothetical protein [Methylobacterium phyllostachyos]SDN44182.1 hypothetical protein SAMN05216360_108151 [Methylobacterium phyllostachyos]